MDAGWLISALEEAWLDAELALEALFPLGSITTLRVLCVRRLVARGLREWPRLTGYILLVGRGNEMLICWLVMLVSSLAVACASAV